MQKRLRQIVSFVFSTQMFPVFLFLLVVLAYGPRLLDLGFYWDDFPKLWIANHYGAAGLERFFSYDRPYWGILFQITTSIFGENPLPWHVFALILRWLTGVCLWWLLLLIWPNRKDLAAWASAFYLVYPGFSQQYVALVFSHYYIVLISFLLSLVCMVLAVRLPKWRWVLLAAGLLASILNLYTTEYFFFPDLIRPAILWWVIGEQIKPYGKRLAKVVLNWLPYLILFLGALYWRVFLQGFLRYEPVLAEKLVSMPGTAIPELLIRILSDIWLVTAGAWGKAFQPLISWSTLDSRVFYTVMVIAGSLLAGFYFWFYRPVIVRENKTIFQAISTSFLMLLLSGGSFWAVNLPIKLDFAADRFTMPFMFGVSLLVAAVILLLPVGRLGRTSSLVILLGLAVGLQFLNAQAYRKDWVLQSNLFWQMSWRIPDLQQGTTLLANEFPMPHYTDNSLTAPLNWLYDPDNTTETMNYLLAYPTVRVGGSIPDLKKGTTFTINYRAATFNGSADQVLVVMYAPPACLHVLDPEIDQYVGVVPKEIKDALVLSSNEWILPQPAQGITRQPLLSIYGPEPAKNWCYYYEKAELARQTKDWNEVVLNGDQELIKAGEPNDFSEYYVFIEGYAHTEQWARALELSRAALKGNRYLSGSLCVLWQRIDREVGSTPEKDLAIKSITPELECP